DQISIRGHSVEFACSISCLGSAALAARPLRPRRHAREPEHHLDRPLGDARAYGRRELSHGSDLLRSGEPVLRSFAGPKRFVPLGVQLSDLPPVDFAVLSHDHYDHTDLASIEALAKRGV